MVLCGVLAVAAAVLALVLLQHRRALQRARRFEAYFNSNAEPILVLDGDLRVVESNPQAQRLLEFTGRRLHQKSLAELLRSEEPLDPAALLGTVSQKGSVALEATVARSDDRAIYVDLRMSRVQPEMSERYVAVLHDVSFRREQFRRYEVFLERLLDELAIEVALLTPEGRYQYLNPAAVPDPALREWLLGRSDFEFCEEMGLHMEVALRRRSYRRQALETRTTVTFEETLPDRTGAERRFLRSYSPHLTPEGDVMVVASFGVDVTETRQLEDQLQAARAEVEKAKRFKEAFLQNVGHELRTPMTGIVGFTQILRDEVPAPLQEFILLIEQNAHRLMETLDSMLDLAGLRAENVTLRPRLLNVCDVVDEAVRPHQRTAEEKGIFLSVRKARPEVLVRLDPASLHRVVHNLVQNAVKFTQAGGVIVEVSVAGGQAMIRIMDSGVGIDRAFLSSIFEEFNQEDPGIDRPFEGLGLGLALTQRLVQVMGGKITVQSDKGQGSMFTITFPVAVPDTEPVEAERPRVLVIDRSAEIQRIVDHHLGNRYRLSRAMTFQDGLDAARKVRHNVVLLDPHIDDEFEPEALLDALRSLPGYERIPVVALDVQRQPGRQHTLLKMGFDQYLAKPFDKIDLLNAVLEVLLDNSFVLK